MLGLLLIYFIGRRFYDLALLHNKSGWLYAISGVVTYYGSSFILGILIFLFTDALDPMLLEDGDEMILNLVSIPIGLLSCWGLYKFLEHRWTHTIEMGDSDFLDDDLL